MCARSRQGQLLPVGTDRQVNGTLLRRSAPADQAVGKKKRTLESSALTLKARAGFFAFPNRNARSIDRDHLSRADCQGSPCPNENKQAPFGLIHVFDQPPHRTQDGFDSVWLVAICRAMLRVISAAKSASGTKTRATQDGITRDHHRGARIVAASRTNQSARSFLLTRRRQLPAQNLAPNNTRLKIS